MIKTILLACTLITGVADGDTFFLGDQTVRLAGVDTPEAWESNKLYEDARRLGISPDSLQEVGMWVSEQVRQEVKGKCVRVEYIEKGYYGRWIVEVYWRGISVNNWVRQHFSYSEIF